MSKVQKIIIASVYAVLSVLVSMIVYWTTELKTITVVIPIVILVITFIVWNTMGGMQDKEKFKRKHKISKHEETYLDNLKKNRNYVAILMGIELLIILVMGTLVYTLL